MTLNTIMEALIALTILVYTVGMSFCIVVFAIIIYKDLKGK